MTSLWAIIGSVINIKTYFVASVRHRHRCSIILFIFVDFFGTNIEHEPKEDSILELNSTIIGFVYTSYYMWGCKQNGVRLSDSRRLFCLKRNWTKLPFYLRVFSWPTCKKDRNFRASIQCQRKRARFCQWQVQRISSRRLEYWFRLLLFHDLQSCEWSEIISQSKSLEGFLVSLHNEAIETDLSAPQRASIIQVTLRRNDLFYCRRIAVLPCASIKSQFCSRIEFDVGEKVLWAIFRLRR